jgi:hypothetical protein
MSFAHLLLIKTDETDRTIQYVAESPDFNRESAWKSVASIVIDKISCDYDFFPVNEWTEIKLVHPKLYALSEAERSVQVEEGACCGAWTGRIHAWVMRLIAEGAYPATYPA